MFAAAAELVLVLYLLADVDMEQLATFAEMRWRRAVIRRLFNLIGSREPSIIAGNTVANDTVPTLCSSHTHSNGT
jgi:hypothetical protein